MEKVDVVIIGGGPAGISAALWCKRLDLNHVLFESKQQLGGQLFQIHNKIIDYPGVLADDGRQMQQLLEQQIKTMECNVKLGCLILFIDSLQQKLIYKENKRKKELHYEYLIFATGSKPKSLNVPGEKEMIERGEVFSATRDQHRLKGKDVAIVGGGDRAFEGAFLLAEAGANIYLIHRSTYFRAREAYQKRVYMNKNIKLLTDTTVLAINGEQSVQSLDVIQLEEKRKIKIGAILVRIGVEPNIALLKNQVETDETGYIIVNQLGETSVPSIFAVGDVCTRPTYSSISASVGQAMVAVKQISEQITS